MPAKTLLAAVQALGVVEKADEVGIHTGNVRIDIPAIVQRKNDLVDYFVRSRVDEFADFDVRFGMARFIDDRAIDVDGARIEADRFIIATGSRIVPPAIPGLIECGYFTSDDALNMTTIPQAMLIIGAGPVGCEFAQYFSRAGSRVTLVQSENEILRNEDPDIAAYLRGMLVREGINVAVATDVVSVSRASTGVIATLCSDGTERDVTVDCVMLATGRKPNIESLALSNAGVKVSSGRLEIDDFLRTTNPRILAAGDVVGRRCLVHVAEWAGRLAEHNAFADDPRVARFADVETHAIYTQPQIAVAGLTESQARSESIALHVGRHDFRDIGKALVSDEPEGFIKMMTTEDGEVRGVAIIGADALDLVNEAVLIIARGMTAEEVAAVPHLHPTMGEIYVRVAEDVQQSSLLSRK
jgi:pyruvate/2-oxoglutarate dehydrogenase complex dihydrolipoamide dehydrogenase (E3) component